MRRTPASRNPTAALLSLLLVAAAPSCSEPVEGTTTGSVSADAGTDGGALQDGHAAQPSGVKIAYAAHRGVSTPWFIPVTADGAGSPIQLGPRRGAGYGMGEGNVSYPDLTPDGSTVVVVFYPMSTPSSFKGGYGAHLFALAIDGSSKTKPIAIARANALRATDRAYNDTTMAYVDGNDLYLARLNGKDLNSPTLVAEGPANMELGGPRFLPDGKHVAFWLRPKSGGSAKGYVAAADGSQASKPFQLTAGDGKGAYLAAIGKDGGLILRGSDNRLYAATDLGDKKPVVLTPKDLIADMVGMTEDGARVAVVLRTTWQKERQLVSVASDGSQANSPTKLTPKPALSLSARMARDGSAVAWTAQGTDKKWAAFAANMTGMEPGKDPRVSGWNSKRLYVTAFLGEAGGLVGARDDGAVLHFITEGKPGQAAKVLAAVDKVVNHSIPWPTLSLDGSYVIYDANTPQGWQAWVVPLVGGKPQEVKTPWYRDLLTPHGILHLEYVHEGAVFVSDLHGVQQQRSPWHASKLHNPHLVEDGQWLIYGLAGDKPGWYAARTAQKGNSQAKLAMPAAQAPDGKGTAWNARPLVAGGHMIRLLDGRVEAFALDGSDAAGAKVLAMEVTAPLIVDPAGGRAIFISPAPSKGPGVDEVLAVTLSGGDAKPVKLMGKNGDVSHLAMLGATDRVLVAVKTDEGTDLYAAATDGSDALSPLLLADGFPGWFLGVVPTATGAHVLSVHSIEATAVPHPDLLMATPVPTGPTKEPNLPHILAPKGFTLWNGPNWMLGFSPGAAAGAAAYSLTGKAGLHVLLRGQKGLHSAHVDGSQAKAPIHLSTATESIGPPLSPDGTRLLLREKGALMVAEIAVADSQISLGKPDGRVVASGRWASDGKRAIVLGGAAPKDGKKARLYAVEVDGGTAQPLHSAEFGVSAFLTLVATSIGEVALLESVDGLDHSIYKLPLAAAGEDQTPQALTPVDDVGETLIGVMLGSP